VTSGVAGLYYGYKNIPIRWIEEIARKEDIEVLA
jgi:ADP-ribosyl-[dinitrogen reductase] hydrolase